MRKLVVVLMLMFLTAVGLAWNGMSDSLPVGADVSGKVLPEKLAEVAVGRMTQYSVVDTSAVMGIKNGLLWKRSVYTNWTYSLQNGEVKRAITVTEDVAVNKVWINFWALVMPFIGLLFLSIAGMWGLYRKDKLTWFYVAMVVSLIGVHIFVPTLASWGSVVGIVCLVLMAMVFYVLASIGPAGFREWKGFLTFLCGAVWAGGLASCFVALLTAYGRSRGASMAYIVYVAAMCVAAWLIAWIFQKLFKRKNCKVYVAGALSYAPDLEALKKFYEDIGGVCACAGLKEFVPHLKYDPVNNPEVSPEEVYRMDSEQVRGAGLLIAYVGVPSLGTGMELEIAHRYGVPIIMLWAEKDGYISRMARGTPAILQTIVFENYEDGLAQLKVALEEFLTER